MIGNKVFCVKSQNKHSKLLVCDLDSRLEIDKIYTVSDVSWSHDKSRKYYMIVSDKGETIGWISANYFKPLSEVREDKLNQILRSLLT